MPGAAHSVTLPGRVPAGWEGAPVFTRPADVVEALRCRDLRKPTGLAADPDEEHFTGGAITESSVMLADPGRLVQRRVLSLGWSRLNQRRRRHFSFSAGRYRCTGAHLVRETMNVAVAEWLSRIPDFEMRGARQFDRYGRAELIECQLVWNV
ncbi:hypothetical protein AWC00_26680 [Mycobacterium conspicuum]|nr:hypothetical protein AWC00_26680 [Mycobacterium conspicuum]